MADIVDQLRRVADSMEQTGDFPRSVPLMRDAAAEIMSLRLKLCAYRKGDKP